MIPRWAKRLFHQVSIGDQSYRFMFEKGPPDEFVAIDCETTGLDRKKDEIITIAAVKIRGDRILTSERFVRLARPESAMAADAIKVHHLRQADVEAGERLYDVWPEFLHFVGGRPLVGYFLEFDVAMIDRNVLRFIGIELPNPMIEVSELYYERKYGDAPPGTECDLTFRAILKDLGLPTLSQHDAFNDALMTAMMFVALRDLKRRGVRIERKRDGPRVDLAH
ncbi:MAG: 3'-5' exonuclease [Methylobacteriaceae bacterium]|nr:3'-5' exonuclease [Methylobacteriaceae bacterium]